MNIGSQHHLRLESLQKLIQGFVQLCTLAFFSIFFKLEIRGGESVDKELRDAHARGKGLLFAANHTHELDAIFVRCMLPLSVYNFPMYYVAMTKDHYQDEKFGWRRYLYGGTFFRMLGAYPAYLGMRDYQASLVHHTELLEEGRSVCIFPEGKISVNVLKPSEPKGGLGFLAVETGTNIIPVRIDGLVRIPWFKVFTFRRPQITVTYKPLLKVSDLVRSAESQAIEHGIQMYKHISQSVMNVVRSDGLH